MNQSATINKSRLFGISRGQGIGLPNLLGAWRKDPQQVGESDMATTRNPRDTKSLFHNPRFGAINQPSPAQGLVPGRWYFTGHWPSSTWPGLDVRSPGADKFAYTLKSPSSNVDRLQDWVRFPFAAAGGTATAGVGVDGFVEGMYPFT